jgi:glycosyltransferase involved in cell wall biosynthesis
MNEKKKILVFIDWFIPGYKAGGPIRSVANMVDRLKHEYEFFILTRNTDYMEDIPYPGIVSDQWVIFDQNVNVCYLSKKNTTKRFIKKIIRETDFQTAYINGIYSWFFSIIPLILLKKSNKKIIVCARGMLSEQAFSRKNIKKKAFLLLTKLTGLYKDIWFHATNEREMNDIMVMTGNKKITVVPNLTRHIEKLDLNRRIKHQGDLNLVSIARISQEKNLKFALEILSNIKIENITFDIYGSIYDKTYWEECKQIIKTVPENVLVSYHDAIESSNVIETFSRYHFSFMPSIGENFGHSLLESMIAGTPVITSNNTPWLNLEQQNIGWDIDLLDKAKFEQVILNCCEMSQKDYNTMSENVFAFARAYSNDKEIISKAIQLFE